ncbi:MAG: sigma-70 family RNA polymerase sigma factor [Candidatus Omnitrophota bacterium]|nr:sigma-70 family RNA polymerase sigma factor [Candidatus Omnitrophota bacterium]
MISRLSEHSSDSALLEACCQHDEFAFKLLYDRYSKLVYSAIHKWIKTYASKKEDRKEDIKDVFQEAFIDMVENNFSRLRQAKDPNKLSGLIFIIAHHRAGKYFTKKWKEGEFVEKDLKNIPSPENIIENLTREEQNSIAEKFLNTLSKKEYDIMELHLHRGFKYDEIAAAMRLSRVYVGVIINRVKNKMKLYIKNKYGEV